MAMKISSWKRVDHKNVTSHFIYSAILNWLSENCSDAQSIPNIQENQKYSLDNSKFEKWWNEN